MIKLQPPSEHAGSYHNFRCGEVFCIGPTAYHVCCALCGLKIAYAKFPEHFRLEHLNQSELSDCKFFDATTEVQNEVEQHNEVSIKTEYDPIAQEAGEEISTGAVDLDQIALLDRDDEIETFEELLPTASSPNSHTKPRRQKKRAAAMRNRLVLKNIKQLDIIEQDHDSLEVPLSETNDKDWLDSESNMQVAELDDERQLSESSDDEVDTKDDAKEMLLQCDECDRHYRTKRGLQGHKRNKHSTTEVVLAEKKKRNVKVVYKCTDCDETFRTERDLRGHRWKHTGMDCDICGKPFTQSGNMLRHRLRHSGIKPYKCQDCDSTFYTQKELNSHKICHTKRMPCICEICGRPCRDRGVLTAHMRRHTGERPAKCDVCGKAFYSFHDLNVHAVSHTNLRPFVCDICGSTFQRKKALRVHKLLHSEVRKYGCKLCSKTFAQSGGLNAHMRTHESARAKAKAAEEAAAAARTAIILPISGALLSTASLDNSVNILSVDNEELLDTHSLEQGHVVHRTAGSEEDEVTITMGPASWHVT